MKLTLKFLIALHRAALGPHVVAVYGSWDEDWQRDRYRQLFWPETISILQHEGRDIGMVQVFRERGCLYLSEFEILPSHQRCGLGSMVLQELKHECDRAGVPFELRVFKNNPAQRLYERHGFVISGETPTHFVMRWESTPNAGKIKA